MDCGMLLPDSCQNPSFVAKSRVNLVPLTHKRPQIPFRLDFSMGSSMDVFDLKYYKISCQKIGKVEKDFRKRKKESCCKGRWLSVMRLKVLMERVYGLGSRLRIGRGMVMVCSLGLHRSVLGGALFSSIKGWQILYTFRYCLNRMESSISHPVEILIASSQKSQGKNPLVAGNLVSSPTKSRKGTNPLNEATKSRKGPNPLNEANHSEWSSLPDEGCSHQVKDKKTENSKKQGFNLDLLRCVLKRVLVDIFVLSFASLLATSMGVHVSVKIIRLKIQFVWAFLSGGVLLIAKAYIGIELNFVLA